MFQLLVRIVCRHGLHIDQNIIIKLSEMIRHENMADSAANAIADNCFANFARYNDKNAGEVILSRGNLYMEPLRS